jgi:hypothetical protein
MGSDSFFRDNIMNIGLTLQPPSTPPGDKITNANIDFDFVYELSFIYALSTRP